MSATKDVRRESIAPRTASTNPALIIIGKKLLKLGSGMLSDKPPSGIAPIRSRPLSPKRIIDKGVTINNAKRGEGTHWLIRRGVRNTIARVIMATPIAAPLGSKLLKSVERDSKTPPLVVIPRRGPIWRVMIITPIPDIKPETTE